MTSGRTATILLVEDDDGHSLLIQERLRHSGMDNPVRRFSDGEEAWEFLSGGGREPLGAGTACVMLLDINLPGVDGFELLRRMKDHAGLRKVPVIILTSSDNPREISAAHALGCSAYVVKPVNFEEFKETIARLARFIRTLSVPAAMDPAEREPHD